MSDELHLRLPRAMRAFAELTPGVDNFMESRQLSAEARYKIKLALEETILNLIKHPPADRRSETIDVFVVLEPGAVVIRVDDESPPFDPTSAARPNLDLPLEQRVPGGLGIHMLREMLDGFDYEHRQGRNSITMRVKIESG